MPLTYAPRAQPWTFWDRHDRYSVHMLMVCDRMRNIISVTLGFTGAAGDALVQHYADWSQSPGEHFAHLEHLLGDKGMHLTVWVVGPCKGDEAETQANKNFNWHLPRLCVVSELVFVMLKGRWASIYEVRLPIGCERDFLWAMDWVLACSVLHNVCNSMGDGDIPESVPAHTTGDPADPQPAEEGAEHSRMRVKEDVLTFIKATGLYNY